MSPLDSENLTEQKVQPLLGKRILVTRPGSQGEDFTRKLRGLGAEPILMPMIELTSPDSWEALDLAIANMHEYKWLLFASSNAVISFANRLTSKSHANSTAIPNIAVIGDTTANAVSAFGFKVNYCPNDFLAQDFVAQFPGYPNNLNNTKILWPRTNLGSDFIAKELTAAGANVDIVAAYKTQLPKNAAQLSNQLQALIHDKKIDAITLASKQTAVNLAKIIEAPLLPMKNALNLDFISRNSLSPSSLKQEALASLKNALQGILIVTIGPETSEGALNYLGKVDMEAKQHSADGIINALIEHYK